jgi:hypothetical protein
MGAFDPGLARAEAGLNTLRGIDTIKVAIEDLTADSTRDGVTEGLQTQAELAVKEVGINVADRSAEGAGAYWRRFFTLRYPPIDPMASKLL